MPGRFEVIGVLSLPDSLGGMSKQEYMTLLQQDLKALQDGGVDTLLIENSGEQAEHRKLRKETKLLFEEFMKRSRGKIKKPFLVAVLPCDYEVAAGLATEYGAKGVWFDFLVEKVIPSYTNSRVTMSIDPKDARSHITPPLMLYTEVMPLNFYTVLNGASVEGSVMLAREYADAICVCGTRWSAPHPADLKMARRVVGYGSTRLGVSGHLNAKNVSAYAPLADFGVFFSALRFDGNPDRRVDVHRVKAVVQQVKMAAVR